MKALLDPKDATGEYPFKWVDSRSTDIRKTFEKYRNAAPQGRAGEGIVTIRNAGQSDAPAVAAPIQSLSLWRKA